MHHVAYDMIAHLCFGQDSNAVTEDGWYEPAKVVFEGIREGVTLIELLRFLPFKALILNALVERFGGARKRNSETSLGKASTRLKSGETDNVDFSEYAFLFNTTFAAVDLFQSPTSFGRKNSRKNLHPLS
jgi:hypothetical protein